jgi:pimeloyl-ACP methyl ester carboxylesterase
MSSFVLCVRDKASGEDSFGGGMGPASYLSVPDDVNVPAPSHKLGGVKQWMDAAVAQAVPPGVAPGNELDIVFFVHGYNTDPEEALKRQRLAEKELRTRGFACMVIGFDWPTAGSATLYTYDRFEAQDTAALLVKAGIVPFAKYTVKDCPINIHIMAHSMGGFVVREAFRSVDKGRNADLPNDWRIGQLVLFGADISSECFALDNADMLPVFAHCGRLTNYFSGYDAALAVSNVKNIDIQSRVGRVGMPTDTPAHDKALDVDCGPRYVAIPDRNFQVISGLTSHSWYLEDPVWYDDLAYTLQGEVDRNAIPTRTARPDAGKNDFILNSLA